MTEAKFKYFITRELLVLLLSYTIMNNVLIHQLIYVNDKYIKL